MNKKIKRVKLLITVDGRDYEDFLEPSLFQPTLEKLKGYFIENLIQFKMGALAFGDHDPKEVNAMFDLQYYEPRS